MCLYHDFIPPGIISCCTNLIIILNVTDITCSCVTMAGTDTYRAKFLVRTCLQPYPTFLALVALFSSPTTEPES